jgi:demethylmenaquinone methyltransferase/2-methoxy-6-polyprenyl-1,4-benzoquinol methylase
MSDNPASGPDSPTNPIPGTTPVPAAVAAQCVAGAPGDDTADFGFRRVAREEKAGMVRAVFDSVAPRYDLMNDLMSLGVHRVWKRIFVTTLDPRPRDTLLDLAGGTGDISFGWLAKGGGKVLLSDINPSMLAVAQDRAMQRSLVAEMSLLVADAERLPLPDRCVDRVSIAFGLRNCTDKPAVLREARRVLKPGGRFCCLEFSRVQVAVLHPLYDTWSFRVLPRLGRMVAHDADSYQYLAESIRTFPDQATLAAMMADAGLARVSVRNLSGGIAAIHSGWRL